jgi:hypothetical protein
VALASFFLRGYESICKRYSGLFHFESGEDDEGFEGGTGFTEQWGWYINLKEVADFENITFEKAQELGVINFLNDLAYLKDKNKHTAWLSRQR